ncbi:MAG: CDP-alcohol phosphatidyltransferase family protein [bacterium]|nr:CDP-alcohol phosphatidyltransferase family protein [bacterium]
MKTVKDEQNGFDYQKSLKDRNTHFVNKFIAVEKYINRPLASLIVRAVFNTPVTPNGLTYCNFFLGLLAAFFFSRGEYFYFVLGGIFIQLSSIVDSADGMLARAKNMAGNYGAHLDIFLDRITDFLLFVGITIGVYRAHPENLDLLITGMAAAGLYILQINLFYLSKNFLKNKNTGETGEARALMLLLIMIFAFADILHIFIYILLAGTVISSLIRLFCFVRLGKKQH